MNSPKTKRVTEIASQQGYILLQQVHRIYQTADGTRRCLSYLVRNKVLKLTEEHGRYEYIGKRVATKQATLG